MTDVTNYADLGRQLDASLAGFQTASKWLDTLSGPDATAAAVALTRVKVDLQSADPGGLQLEEAIADYLRANADSVVEAALAAMEAKGDELRKRLADAVKPRAVKAASKPGRGKA
jgi:hypothetical protein